MTTFRIISFDSGGVGGALSTRLLKRLCKKYPTLIDRTHLFAGTSTGSLIALSLSFGKSAEYIDDLFCYENMKKVFSPPHINLLRPKFDNSHLLELLLSVFPKDLCISELNKYVFVPSFNVKGVGGHTWSPVFFNNLPLSTNADSTAICVALSSSAAPTYLPSYDNFIDGGVMLNSPTAAPILYTRSAFQKKYKFCDFRLLSIGTGQNPHRISQNTSHWGVLRWGLNLFGEVKTPLIEILLNDTTSLENFYAAQLLEENFFRIDPPLETKYELDDYKIVPYLKQIADETDLNETYDFIENHFLQ